MKHTQHYDQIANTWANKYWVEDAELSAAITGFVEENLPAATDSSPPNLLYLGCGTGAICREELFSTWDILGIDSSQEMLNRCPDNMKTLRSDLSNLESLDQQFDLTFSRKLLTHCPPSVVCPVAFEHLKPGGMAISIESVVVNDEQMRVATTGVRTIEPEHGAFLMPDDITKAYQRAGFVKINTKMLVHRRAWLKSWLKAEQATTKHRDTIIKLYESASHEFKNSIAFDLSNGEITSNFFWLMTSAQKPL